MMSDQPLMTTEMAYRRFFQISFNIAMATACLWFTWPLVKLLIQWGQTGHWTSGQLSAEMTALYGVLLFFGIPFILGAARMFAFELLPFFLARSSRPAPHRPRRSSR